MSGTPDPGVVRHPTAGWDAGDLGCGELVLELRGHMNRLPPGALFELVAHDPGAPEDLPAWCRLTRHELIDAIVGGAKFVEFLASGAPCVTY